MAGPFKLSADVPVLGSPRFLTHSSWSKGFTVYTSCFSSLTVALAMDPAVDFAAYTAVQRTSNNALRLVLQHALSEDHWTLIDSEPRACCNLARLREVAIASELSHSAELQVSLSTLTMAKDEALHPYWARGLKIQSRLTSLGIAVSDDTLIMWLLRGLPQTYGHYRSIARLHTAANASTFSMLAFLQVHEHEMSHQAAAAPPSQRQGSRSCFTCGSPGHVAAFCPNRRGQVSGSTGSMGKPECSHCFKIGHTAAQCFSLHPELRTQSGPSPTCTHCGRVGHTAERCFRLIGYPQRDFYEPRRERSRSPAARPRSPARINYAGALPPAPAREGTPFRVQG